MPFDELAHLRDRVATLEVLLEEAQERNAQLVKAFGQFNDVPNVFGLTQNEGAILGALMAKGKCDKKSLHFMIYNGKMDDKIAAEKIIDVWVCKLRAKVKPYGIKIATHWGFGYSIDEASCQIVRDMMAAENGSQP